MHLGASIFFFLTGLLLLTNVAFAQTAPPRCATEFVTERLEQQFPELRARQQQGREQVRAYQKKKTAARQMQPVTVIPVVFHVVYRTNQENIPDAQLLSQIEVLNTDYRRRNPDTTQTLPQFKNLAADTRLQFCLASRDPNGNPTTGIERRFTSTNSFDLSDAVKFNEFSGLDAWDPNRYLNIWVCNLSADNLGYAQYPDGPADTDGVVLDYTTIGRPPFNPFTSAYNLGRTGTHEVGHWLGLQHIWGSNDSAGCSDSDDIADTPNQDDATTGCPTGARVSCSNGPRGDMYQNYLDYTNDACMNLFTRDQAAYMQAVLNTSRSRILSSAVCANPLQADFTASDTIVVAGTTVQFQDASIGVRATAWQWNFEGGEPITATGANPAVQFNIPGKYTISLTVSLGSISDAVTKEFYIRVTSNEERIYPNPSPGGVVTLEAPANRTLQQIYLLNSIGQTVLYQATKTNITTLRVDGLANGLYYCRFVYEDGRIATRKLVIMQ